jgi:hypothetical protein
MLRSKFTFISYLYLGLTNGFMIRTFQTFLISPMHDSHPFIYLLFDYPNNIWLQEQSITPPPTMYFSSSSCYFLTRLPRYSSQHPTFIHPQSTFSPWAKLHFTTTENNIQNYSFSNALIFRVLNR